MTSTERQSLRNGATYAVLWGGAVAFASNGKPLGLVLAAVVALLAGLVTTGVRLPLSLLRDGAGSLWRGTKQVPGLWSSKVPVKILLPLVVAFAGRGCDGIPVPELPDIEWEIPDFTPAPPEVEKATAATYVYEKDDHAVPVPVMAALDKLNRKGVAATLLDADVTDGTGDTPEQYRVAVAEAKKAGLPALIVTAGDKVLAVVPNPKSEQEVLEAIQ